MVSCCSWDMLNMTFGNKHQEGIVDLMDTQFFLYTNIDIDCKVPSRYNIHLHMDFHIEP